MDLNHTTNKSDPATKKIISDPQHCDKTQLISSQGKMSLKHSHL
jgi:hypothetical protein